MVSIAWVVLLAVHLWSYIYTEATICMAKFDHQLMCPQNLNDTLLIADNNTGSVIACSYLCSSDLKCRSFQYNPYNNKCRTNAERLATSNTSCSHPVRYGEIQKATCRGFWLFEPCVFHNDCFVANSSCLHGRCECSYGHPYDYRTDSCLTSCAIYGNTLHEVSYYLDRQNTATFDDIDIAECHARCFSTTTFVCRLIEYEVLSNRCQINTKDSRLCELNAITANPATVTHEESASLRQWDRNCG